MRILLVLALIALLAAVSYWLVNSPPRVQTAAPIKTVGRTTPFRVTIEDGNGLRRIRAWWEQDGRSLPIAESDAAGARRHEVTFELGAARQQALKDGAARLLVEATDAAWLLPKTGRAGWDLAVRLQPPRLTVISGQHYVNQGGCDMVVYQVSESAVSSGVRVGRRLFPGYPLPGGAAGHHFAIFAFPYNEPAGAVPLVVARDDAGNEAVASFWFKLFPRKFRQRDIELTDEFLQKVVPAILSQSPEVRDQGDALKSFLEINGTLRRLNNERIAALAAQTEKRFLWREPFSQLSNSQVEAQFADHRAYRYQGKEVDRRDHLGFDLATVQQAPATAANRGKVIFAGWLGIYGNTVVLDHGYGLQSLYAHLSRIQVKPGDIVEKRQELGRSGSTGLAAGDHLHFSMTLDGEQVNPTEWWDPHWIHDRLLVKFPGGKLPAE